MIENMYWQELTFRDFERMIDDNTIAILPIGSLEEHGPHLPMGSDTYQAIYVAEEISKKLNAIILPPINYGYTELDDYKGTISISFDSIYHLTYDILIGIVKNGIKKVVIISGHASQIHMAAIRKACNEITKEYVIKIMLLSDYDIAYELRGKIVPSDDSHAGVIETSRMMHIREDLVKNERKFEKKEKGDFLVIQNYSTIFPDGTLSDPSGSSKELGEKINKYIIKKILKTIKYNFSIK